jgi:predicted nucleic acid-binding protein
VIVADTGAMVALIDRDDKHHEAMLALYENDPTAWVLPWAILPEVDYLVARYLGDEVATAFMTDVAHGAFVIEWGDDADTRRALEIRERYRSLKLGLVDSVVAAVAERIRASAIATIDQRDFGALDLIGRPKLFPRDLS